MIVSNIIDRPRIAGADDLLGIDKYTDALVRFIETCEMPTTLAIQGEWGSGKTSLLNQIRHRLCENELDPVSIDKKEYYGIWVNTWQYSLMKTKDEALISIIKGLTSEIMRIVKRKHETKTQATLAKVGGLFTKIAQVGAKVAATTAGMDGEALVSGLFGSDDGNTESLLSFKNALSEAIGDCLKEDALAGNNNKGFIFFIDDLDRIDPPVAVEILELIKNIFEVDNCIFVLAIDYEVVVKGLVPKFGPLTEKNEREFRSFFDKIIQLPFSMPVSNYNVSTFLLSSLSAVGYIDERFEKDTKLNDTLTELAMLSVGTNPRALKRLINTLSLLSIISELDGEGEKKKEVHELLVNFGLVCTQIAYPKLYTFLVQEPNYKAWSENTAKKHRLPEINEAQEALLEGTTEFDEEWEKVLFRKCMQDPFLSSRAFQVSQFFNFLAELVPDKLDFGGEIQRILGLSAITSVNLDGGSRKLIAPKFSKVRFDTWEDFENEFKINYPDAEYLPVMKFIHDTLIGEYQDLIKPSYGTNTLTFNVTKPKTREKCFLYFQLKKKKTNAWGGKFQYSELSEVEQDLWDYTKETFNRLSVVQI
ncbi:MAG: P-loop NTPase fold protein [Paludibacter sp.]